VGDPLKLTASEILAVAVVAGPLLLAAGGLELGPRVADVLAFGALVPGVALPGAPLPGATVLPQAAASNAHAPAAALHDRSRPR
jgi:hypothetical protein